MQYILIFYSPFYHSSSISFTSEQKSILFLNSLLPLFS
ncbi:hypothetical protein HMPREF1145_0626 [Oribacterium parvum ACB8]|nr:hypothetical protein HMPREF1145_0626 [Oribacterium parvum ACB8]